MIDEWSGFAGLLANMIEKYAAAMELDQLPDPTCEAKPLDDNREKIIHTLANTKTA